MSSQVTNSPAEKVVVSGRAKWVAMHDVDEFVQSMIQGQTVAEFLHANSHLEHIGAFKIYTHRFGAAKLAGEQPARQLIHLSPLHTFNSK
jgi:hypothetical protein